MSQAHSSYSCTPILPSLAPPLTSSSTESLVFLEGRKRKEQLNFPVNSEGESAWAQIGVLPGVGAEPDDFMGSTPPGLTTLMA